MLLTAARSSCEGGAGGGGDGTAKDPHCQAQGTLGGSGTDPLVGSTEGQAGAWEPPHVFTFSSPTDHRRVTYHRAPARSALAPLSPTSIRANADMSASVLSKARGMALSPPTSPGRVKQKTPVKEAARPGSAPVSPPSSDPSTNAENALGVAVGLTAFAQRLQRIDEEPAQPASDPPAEHCEKAAVPEAAPAPAEADDEDTATRGIVLPSYGLDDSDDEDENASPAQRNSSKQPRKQALPRPSLSLHAGRRKPFAPLGATSAGSSAAGPGSALRATSGGSPGSSWARLNQKLHTPQDKAPRHPSQSPGSSNGEPRKKSPGSQGSAPRSVGAFEFDPYYSAPSFAIVEIPAPPPRPQSPAPIEDCSSPFFVPPPLAAAGNSPSEPPAKPHKKRKHREIEGLPSSGKHRKHLVTRSGPGGHVAKAPNLRHPPKLKLKKVPPPGHPAYLKTKAFSNSASRLAAKADSVIIGSMPVTYKKLKTGAGGESHRGASAPKQGSPLAKEQSSSSPPSSPLSNMSDKENGREASRWLPLPVKARKFTEEQAHHMLRVARESLKNTLNCHISQSVNKLRKKRLECQRDELEKPVGSHTGRRPPSMFEGEEGPGAEADAAGMQGPETPTGQRQGHQRRPVTSKLAVVAYSERTIVKLGPEDHESPKSPTPVQRTVVRQIAVIESDDLLDEDIQLEDPAPQPCNVQKPIVQESAAASPVGSMTTQETVADAAAPAETCINEARAPSTPTKRSPGLRAKRSPSKSPPSPLSLAKSPERPRVRSPIQRRAAQARRASPVAIPGRAEPVFQKEPCTSPPNSDDGEEDEVLFDAVEDVTEPFAVFAFEGGHEEHFVEANEAL